MAKTTLIWLTLCSFIIGLSYGEEPAEYNGYCINMFLHKMEMWSKLENCTVVIGDLKFSPIEMATPGDFKRFRFPKLIEVTGFVVIYRIKGLETLGNLFPNLARIRGNTLLYNYALIVFDMPSLQEVGLYNLLKIDRGGVIIWANPRACFVDTVDWNAIAPDSRHVLGTPEREAGCNFQCSCSKIISVNRCWNNRKCQRFLHGPEGENCSSECLGCRITNHTACSLCRNYTYRGECVASCPGDTYILAANNRCVTVDECLHLNHWIWNGKCISECPYNFTNQTVNGSITCAPCDNCQMKCRSLNLYVLSAIQSAEKCVYVEGHLKIHPWFIPKVVDGMNYYLRNIVEVSDYILIYGSIQITSLYFLPSLKRIRGQKLYNGTYSLVIRDMENLQNLFLPNVTQNLKVDNGSLNVYRNRMLCMSEINKLKTVFPIAPNTIDVPPSLNGYSAGCAEIKPELKIRVQNETYAIATFYTQSNADDHYALLYVKIPHDSHTSIVPEACSDSEWNAVNVPHTSSKVVAVALASLKPASTYAVCLEKYDPKSLQLARSSIKNFTTAVGKPKPPFILELVASSYDVIVIRWVNHLDYKPYITKYELDVILVDIHDHDLTIQDHCAWIDDDLFDIDYTRHAKVMRPPNNYERGCESKCGILSSVTHGAMVEEYFDVCSAINGCNDDIKRPINFSSLGVIKSLAIDINSQNNDYQVGGLLPFRDYKFHLRACTKEQCSTSATGVVRTLRLDTADIATITVATANRSGFIHVKWEPPTKTNGPVLSYRLEVYSDAQIYDINHLLPQVWCVTGKQTNLTVKSNIAEKYLVRICSTTLGNACIYSEWMKVAALTEYELAYWWNGLLFGVFIPIFSCIIGWQISRRSKETEDIPLVDATTFLRQESEAPATMFTELMPASSILQRDLNLE